MDDGRRGRIVAVAALLSWLWVDALRVWLPSVLFVVGDAGTTSAYVMGGVALAVAIVPVASAVVLTLTSPPRTWQVALIVAGVSRIVNQFVEGGTIQFAVSTTTVVATVLAIGLLASGIGPGAPARLGVLVGVAAASAVQATAGGYDLLWRSGFVAPMVSVGIAAALVALGRDLLAERSDDEGADRNAWTWLVLGPVLLLFLVLVAPPGRVALATHWPDHLVAATVIGFAGLLVLGAVLVRALAPRVGGGVAGLAVLPATVGVLSAGSVVAVTSQALLAVSLGALIGSLENSTTASAGRRAGCGAGWFAVFVSLGFAYYAPYDVALGYPPRTVLLATAGVVAVAGIVGSRPSINLPVRPYPATRHGAAVVAATLLLAGSTAIAQSPATVDTPEHRTDDDSLTVALYNLRMGFDIDGRLSILDLADTLARSEPDIVVLNEVDRGWLTTGGRDTLRMVQRRLGLPYVFAPAADEIWGNAILSRYPLLEAGYQRLPRGSDPMARSQLTAVLELEPDRSIAVIATHLSHVDDQGDTRVPQTRTILASVARLQDRDMPVIVAGDLNAQPGSVELSTFTALLSSAIPYRTPTWPSWSPEVQIDHILVSDDFVVSGHGVFDHTYSDHLGLFARLEIVS